MCHRHAGFKAVFVKAVAGPGAAKPGVVLPLDSRQPGLCGDRGAVEHRVCVAEFGNDFIRLNRRIGVECDHHRRIER